MSYFGNSLSCPCLRLGASASQVGSASGKDQLKNLLAIVGQLQQELQKETSEEALEKAELPPLPPLVAASAPGPDDDIDGEPIGEDEDQETQADAESVKEVEEKHEKSKQEASANPKPVATPARANFCPEEILGRLRSHGSEASLPTTAVMSPARMPEPASSMPRVVVDQRPVPVINSSTHKREYMRLVPWLAF